MFPKTGILLMLLTGWTIMTSTQAAGQDDPPMPDITLEEIMAETDDETYAAQVYEDLLFLASNPLNINTATEEDLARLYYLNDFQIFSILDYRKSYGVLLSLSELQLIPGLREDLIGHILPYVTTGNPSLVPVYSGTKSFHARQNILLRTKFTWPVREGFRKDADSSLRFQGPPVSRLIRYELKAGKDLRAGFTMESDPGEPLAWNDLRRGFDFSSAFFEIRDKGPLQELVAGDFRYASGCGLVAGTGRKSKSSEVILKQKNSGVSRSASAAEYGINRGLAAMFTHGNWNARMMLSAVKTSANTEMTGDSTEVFTTLNLSGLFRNEKETAFRHNLEEKQAGAGFGYRTGKFALDYNIMAQFFDKAYRYRIRPDRFSATRDEKDFYCQALDYTVRNSKLLINGETALGRHGHPATLNTLTAWLHPLLTICMSYRYYDPEYVSLNASAFAESDVRNEEGFYFGIEAYAFPFLKVSAYLDQYRFPWLKYNGISPEWGHDMLMKCEFKAGKDFNVTSLLKYEAKETGAVRDKPGISVPGNREDLRYMVEGIYEMNETMRFRTKVDYRWAVVPGETMSYHGIFLCQDIGCHFFNDRITLNARYALFDSPDWSTRIYAYENDILYSFSTPAFYQKGSRMYLSGRIKLIKRVDLWFKYGVTRYAAPYTSGTGADKRAGAVYRDLGLEMVVRL